MILHYLQGCFGYRKDNQAIARYFHQKQVRCSIGYYKVSNYWIRYLETGDHTKPLVIFVHGAPGSSNAFLHFMCDEELLGKAHMISVDRPGYGYSGFGNTVVSLEQQAAMLRPLLHKTQAGRLPILAGHSYGGTIVARMAMDYPAEVGALVMAAPAADPRLEKIFGISYPADWFLLKKLVPTCLRVTNEEKLGHVAQLNRMLPLWKNIRAPATVIHGKKDKIAPVGNADFIQKQISNAPVEMIIAPELGHLLPWRSPGLIKEAIKKYLD